MKENGRLFDLVEMQLSQFPKDDMLVAKENGEWTSYSTRQVWELSGQLACGLLELGISGNDMKVDHQEKLAVISRNRPEWIILDLACQRTGAILCPIYPTSHINELTFIFNEAEIKYVFVSDKEMVEKVEMIKEKTPALRAIISFDPQEGTIFWKDLLKKETHLLELQKKAAEQIKPEHCATIIYTSGTTGVPKGVMLSHQNIYSNVFFAKKSFPFENNRNSKALSFLPLNHIFERMASYVYISSGISIYYAEGMETIGDNIREIQPNIFTTVPRLLEKIYDKIVAKGNSLKGFKRKIFYWALELANQYDNLQKGSIGYSIQLALANRLVFKKWREALGNRIDFVVTGGAACQVRLIRIFTAAGIPIYEGYGPTENSPAICINRRSKGGTKFGTVGPVLDGQELKLQADGEICVKGPSVMMGYYKRPELTAETIIDGWLHTGDIGEMDGKYLRITDRKKELFKTSGGKYVAPAPIENKIKESPYVEQIMIVGAEEKFVGALIVPSLPNLREWMKKNQIDFTSPEEAVNHAEVRKMYRNLLDSFNQFFNPYEHVKKFELLSEEWSIDSGELTPTLKPKRKVIMEKHKNYIERMYK